LRIELICTDSFQKTCENPPNQRKPASYLYTGKNMLKPIRWKTFPLDFLRIQIGFALYGISIVLMIKSNLGTGAWAVLDVALSNIIGLSVGRMTMLSGFVVLTIALAMREQVGWGRSAICFLSVFGWILSILLFRAQKRISSFRLRCCSVLFC